MIKIQAFPFNSFQVNTFILSNETGKCIIIDPGCSSNNEKEMLYHYISTNGLTPELIVYTHAHIDHILGAKSVAEHYNIDVAAHKGADQFLKTAEGSASVFGMDFEGARYPDTYLKENDILKIGDDEIQIIEAPGHADGSICLYARNEKFVVVGDVLFKDSIGRTDLPTGDYDLLMENINSKLFTLPDDVVVYPGHGPATSIGHEKINNPFVRIS